VYIGASNASGKTANFELRLDGLGGTSYAQVGGADVFYITPETVVYSEIRPAADLSADLGTAVYRFGTLYVNQIIATTISGTTMSGAEWEYTGSMVIDANSASATTVSITNQGAGTASLDVEGSITLGGTVDGVDIAFHNSSTAQHGATGAVVGTTNTQTLSAKTFTLPKINDTSSTHQYVFAVSELAAHRTVTLPLLAGDDTFVFANFAQVLAGKTLTTPTIGDFTNAQHAHTDATSGGTIAHSSLTGRTANDHHNQSHVLATNLALGADHTISGATAGHVLKASSATAAAFAQLLHSDLGSVVADQHVAHTGVTITAGNGLTGGGAIDVTRTLTLGTPGSSTASSTNAVTTTSHTHAIDSTIARSAIQIIAGNGLTGGGTLAADRTLTVGAGTMITVGATTVGISTGATYQFIGTGAGTAASWINLSTLAGNGLSHSAGVLTVGAGTLISVASTTVGLAVGTAQYQMITTGATPFTPAYTAMSTLAGAGLTFATGSLAVGAGAGITVNADDVSLTTPGSLTATSTNSSSGSHTHAIDSTIARSAITITAGNGLTGGGDLTANRTLTVGAGTLITVAATTVGITAGATYQFIGTGAGTAASWINLSTLAGAGLTMASGVLAVGAGLGITVNADDVALTTPGTLTASTTNSSTGSHTHAVTTGAASTLSVSTANAAGSSASLARADHLHTITSSSNPGAAASLLASSAAGLLTLVGLDVDTISDRGGANVTLAPTGDLILDPGGKDVLPNSNYDISLGSLSKKYLTLHAAELWVETLVAQETIATIGGRILVGQSTTLTSDLTNVATTMNVKHNNFRNGDIGYLEANGQLEFIQIASEATGTGPYTYTIQRNKDGTGAGTWYAGDAIFNTGTTGNGFIDLYSLWSLNGRNLSYIYNWSGTAFSADYSSSAYWTPFGDGANNAINDCVYFGLTGTTWNNLYFNITTAAVYSATLVWEYWNGAAWTAFTPTVSAGTAAAAFKTAGAYSVTWTTLASWAATSVNGLTAFWVRARVSAFTSWTTLPRQSDRKVRAVEKQYGPTIVGNVRDSATWNDFSERWAIGNLDGLYDYGVDTYGVAFGKQSAAWMSIDDANGLRIKSGSTTVGSWDISGNVTVGDGGGENVYIDAAGVYLRSGANVYTSLAGTTLTLGLSTAEHVLVNTSGVALRDNTTVYGVFAATTTIGSTSTEHVSITSSGLQIKDGATVYTDITAGVISVGATSAEHVLINTSGVALKDNTTVYGQFAATTTIGSTATEHVSITSSGLKIKDGATVYTDVAAGVISVGNTAAEHVLVNTSGVALKDAAVVYAQFAATTTIGITTAEHVLINATSFQIKDSTSVYTDLTAGVLTLGLVSSGDYITLDSTNGLRLYNAATVSGHFKANGDLVIGEIANSKSRIEITSGAVNIINRSAGAVDTTVISLTSAGAGSFSGTITASAGSIGGWTLSSTRLLSGSGATTVGIDSGGTNPAFYAGSATPGSAPFRVTGAGVLTATSGTVGGWTMASTTLSATNITLTSGIANTARILAGTGATAGGINSAAAAGDIVFWAGGTHANRATSNFRVTAGGALTAVSATLTTATVSGAITATSGAISGPLTMVSGSIAIGATPPSSATVGSGIWLDSTGLYGLSGSVLQTKIGSDGKIVAGGGKSRADADGFSVEAKQVPLGFALGGWAITTAGTDYSFHPPVISGLNRTYAGSIMSSVGYTTEFAPEVNATIVISAGNDKGKSLSAQSEYDGTDIVLSTKTKLLKQAFIQVYANDVVASGWGAYGDSFNTGFVVLSDSSSLSSVFNVENYANKSGAPTHKNGARLDGHLTFYELAAVPHNPTASTEGRIFIFGDRLAVQFNDAGTVRYKYMSLNGTDTSWKHDTASTMTADTGVHTSTFTNSGLRVLDTNASHYLAITPGSDLTANRTLTVTTGDAARTVTINGNPTLNDWFDQSVKTTAGPTFASLYVTPGTGVGIGIAPSSSYNIYANDTYTANGTRAGIYNLVNVSDVALTAGRTQYAAYNQITNNNTDVSAYALTQYGSYNYVINASDSGAGSITNAFGSYNRVINRAADATYSTITNAYGSYNYIHQYRAGTTTNAYGVYSYIDRDAGTLTNGWLFYGVHAGTIGTKYGIVLTGETTNSFSGSLSIGTTLGVTGATTLSAVSISGNVTAKGYAGAIFVPLTTPLTSTAWDGDAYSTIGTSTLLDLSAVFGVPAGVKAVLLYTAIKDSAAINTGTWFFQAGPSSTWWNQSVVRCYGGDLWHDRTEVVSCDANGDFYYRIGASGASTMGIYLRIWGYWV